VTKKAWIAAAVSLAACGGSPRAAQATPTRQTSGPLGDTWTGDGATWHRAAGAGPTARYLAALAYDSKRNVFVLFGGQTAKGTSDETWTWDGKVWKQMSPAHKPPPRRAAGMAYDPAHQVVVLFGGRIPDQAEGRDANDTWTWDGSDWVQVDTGPGPPPVREGLSLITADDRIILFGGHFANAVYFGDAWSWDGKTWSRVDIGPMPPGRGAASVAWDPVDSSLFVVGGVGFNATAGPGAQGTPLGDGWTLAGGRWTQLTGSGPGRLAYANAIWDRAGTRVVVLFGMRCPDPSDAAWAWDGRAWSQLANTPIPPRWGATLAQNTDGKALLFGGSNEPGC
jgi:Galactose oxidase, central domain